jgi:hypothetical protein
MIYLRNVLVAIILCAASITSAQVTNTVTSVADAFLCAGSTNYNNGEDLTGLNFGGAGTLVVAPPSSPKGEFQSVIRFDLSSDLDLFNSTYGSNHWTVTGVALILTSNYGTQGVQPNNPIFPTINAGKFVIEWLSDDDWVEGTGNPNLPTTDGVCYNSLPDLLSGSHEILCTNLYTPPGNNIPVTYPLPLSTNVVNDIVSGTNISFLFYAADDQIACLFNSYFYGRGNEPKIQVVATPILAILSCVITDGAFHLTGTGANNSVYDVQVSTNLYTTNWMTIGTTTSDDSGAIQFNDQAVIQAKRFYRLSQ